MDTACFREGGPIDVADPPWLTDAANRERTHPATTFWVYDIHHQEGRRCCVSRKGRAGSQGGRPAL